MAVTEDEFDQIRVPATELTVRSIGWTQRERVVSAGLPKAQSRRRGAVNAAVINAVLQVGRPQVLLAYHQSAAGSVGDGNQIDAGAVVRPGVIVKVEGAGVQGVVAA